MGIVVQTLGFISAGFLAVGSAPSAIAAVDYGDAPSPYPTLLADDGARHTITGLYLGSRVDAEADGQPGGNSTDNDGVVFVTALFAGQLAQVNVTVAGGAGFLNAWIDFDGNGVWSETGEKILTDHLVNAGVNTIYFSVPAGAAASGDTWARFRLAPNAGPLSYTGLVEGGEVEDYSVTLGDVVVPEPVNLALAGFGILGLTARLLKARARR